MQSTGDETTDVLIDLIGTEDNDEESRSDNLTFSALHPAFNSALVAAQSTARPAAFNRRSDSGSDAGSSLRDRSGRFSYDRIREELVRGSTSQSHSDVTPLSWTRSVSTQGRNDEQSSARVSIQEPELIRFDPSPPAITSPPNQVDQHGLVPGPNANPPLSLLSPLNLNPPLSDGDIALQPTPPNGAIDLGATVVDTSSLPVWQNITGLFELMQSQMASLSRALELARADSAVLRERCLDLEARLGIEGTPPSAPTNQHPLPTLPIVPQPQRPDDIRSLTPPREPDTDRPRASTDTALTFVRNIDELVWRRSLFANSPAELAKLASLPDCVRDNDDILDSRNLAALEERIRLWESIVRRTQT